jgi:hypothetical protein
MPCFSLVEKEMSKNFKKKKCAKTPFSAGNAGIRNRTDITVVYIALQQEHVVQSQKFKTGAATKWRQPVIVAIP